MTTGEPAYRADRSDGVLTLSFNRPEAGNALPSDAVPALTQLLRSINEDGEIRAVLVRGEGKTFSAGGDIRAFAKSLGQPVEARQADFHARMERTSNLVRAYLSVAVPVVAACRGAAAGAGLLFVLGADYVLADETAVFAFVHQRVGLTPDAGVTFLLPRVVGARRAAELVLTAARVSAAEAYRIGIVSRLVAPDALEAAAAQQARQLAQAPQYVVRSAKALLASGAEASLNTQLDAERDAIVTCVGQPAFAEGVAAFLEKRQPDFGWL